MENKDRTMLLGRREYPRLGSHIPIRFGGDENRSQDSLTKDLGGGGVRLVSRDFLPVDSKVKLEFFLTPASEALKAVGKVVWIKKLPYSYQHDVGIQFMDIPEPTRKRLTHFVEQNLTAAGRTTSFTNRDSYRDFPYTIAL